jgi:hypothetical protein
MSQQSMDLGREPLEDLAWIWEDRLELRVREAYPHDRWLLQQRGRPVAAIEQTTIGWALTSATQHWRATVRRRRGRLGWHLEVTPSGERAPLLHYRPSTFRAGGTLTFANAGRYKLRRPGQDWALARASGDILARISLRTSPPSGFAVARDQTGLRPAAAREPNLALLIATACAAMVIHHQQPRSAGPLV